MEECGVGCACKSSLLKALSQLVGLSLCTGRPLEEDVDCSEDRARVLVGPSLYAGSLPPPPGIEVPLGEL